MLFDFINFHVIILALSIFFYIYSENTEDDFYRRNNKLYILTFVILAYSVRYYYGHNNEKISGTVFSSKSMSEVFPSSRNTSYK